jgi:integrase
MSERKRGKGSGRSRLEGRRQRRRQRRRQVADVQGKQPTARFLSDAEVEALIKACLPHLKPIVKVALLTGMRRSGLEDFRFHGLRHTFASHLVRKGVGLKAVQELLGHADIKMTMRYSHLKEAVAVLNNLGIDTKLTQNPHQNKKAGSLTPANLL